MIATKAKKEEIAICKEYANNLGITPSKFALKSMLYCIKNNIIFNDTEDKNVWLFFFNHYRSNYLFNNRNNSNRTNKKIIKQNKRVFPY